MFASRSDAGVLLPPTTSSSLGFEATLSVAMDLERRLSVNLLKSQENGPSSNRSDDSPTQLPRISPALPTGGNAKNHEEVCTTDESLESDHSSSCEGISNHKQIPNNVSDEDEEDGNESHQTSNGNGFTWDDPVTKSEPRRRSGKAKNYRCKQCIFVATTKSDFWEHSKTHIKAEKLLTCPKCPFVTEYKHHLEYHLRNHFGSKPFKCDQCAYSCVNKSMLNSHMKSHSDIYQFQCADCSYATKYCHSLKLHLRKYHHKASDSSIELMPNMDISANNKSKIKNGNGVSHDQQVPPFIYGFHFEKEMSPDKSLKCNLCDFTTSVQEHLGKHMLIHAATENKDLCSIYGINSEALIENKKINGNSNGTELVLNAGVRVLENPRSVLFGPTIPLDLSNNANGREKHEELESVVSVSATKNRRKGKAFKLDRVCFQVKQEKVEENELGDDEPASSSQSSPQGPQLMNGNEKNKVKEKNGNGRKDYECSHCGIIFKNDVMYSVHMGFHGFYDPFQCNICGEVTDDKIQFFLHIGKNAHLC